MFKEIGAHHRGKRVPAKAVVVYLHEHIGQLAASNTGQVTNPPSVGAQTHGKVSGPGAHQSVHLPPMGDAIGEWLEANLVQLLKRFLALLPSQPCVERCIQVFFSAATVVAKVPPGMGTEVTQCCVEGLGKLEPMFARHAAGLDAEKRPDLLQGGKGLFRTLANGCPSNAHPGLNKKLLDCDL